MSKSMEQLKGVLGMFGEIQAEIGVGLKLLEQRRYKAAETHFQDMHRTTGQIVEAANGAMAAVEEMRAEIQ